MWRLQRDFLDLLFTILANKADKLPGFESVSEVRIRELLKEAVCEVCC